jgi:hypothetical protein
MPLSTWRGRSIVSPLLGLELRVVGGWLRVINPATGKPYLSPHEQQAQLRAAERRAWREAQARKNVETARQAAEAAQRAAEEQTRREATARQEAEMARQQAEERAQHEAAARQEAEDLAQREAAARQKAEARLQAAPAELAGLRGDPPAQV